MATLSYSNKYCWFPGRFFVMCSVISASSSLCLILNHYAFRIHIIFPAGTVSLRRHCTKHCRPLLWRNPK